jgi:hypothetical protein
MIKIARLIAMDQRYSRNAREKRLGRQFANESESRRRR